MLLCELQFLIPRFWTSLTISFNVSLCLSSHRALVIPFLPIFFGRFKSYRAWKRISRPQIQMLKLHSNVISQPFLVTRYLVLDSDLIYCYSHPIAKKARNSALSIWKKMCLRRQWTFIWHGIWRYFYVRDLDIGGRRMLCG
jgi:hypothetical protein